MAENRKTEAAPGELPLPERQELAARLICSGMIPPRPLDQLTQEAVEEITAGLPSVHIGDLVIREQNAGEVTISAYGINQAEVEIQLDRMLPQYEMQGIPEFYPSRDYSPQAWLGFMRNRGSYGHWEEMKRWLDCWQVDYVPERLQTGFSDQAEAISRQAQELLEERREDLMARLACMGLISPLDYFRRTPEKADAIIAALPPLVDMEIIFDKEDGSQAFYHFINLAEYQFRSKTVTDAPADKPGKMDDPRNNRFKTVMYQDYSREMQEEDALNDAIAELFDARMFKVTLASESDKSLKLQVEKFFAGKPELQNEHQHVRAALKHGYAWLDFLNQEIESAIPMTSHERPSFSRLKRAFETWEFAPSKAVVNWQAGFRQDRRKNSEEARMTFFRTLFSKLATAEIIKRFPPDEWFAMNSRYAEEFARQHVPLLPDQRDIGDWLTLFGQPRPDDPIALYKLQRSFQASGIPFHREAVCKAFTNPKTKGKQSMSINPQNELKYLVGAVRHLIEQRQMPPVSPAVLGSLSLEEVREMLREDPRLRLTDDQAQMLANKQRAGYLRDVALPPGGIRELSRPEASYIINNTPRLSRAQMMPENPATEETRNYFQRLIRNSPEMRLPAATWNYISEEALQGKIRNILASRPISEQQLAYLNECYANQTLPMEVAKQFIDKPTIGPDDFSNLNQYQAREIFNACPATPNQIEYFRSMSDNHPLKPAHPERMTYLEARELRDKISMRGKTIDPEGPIIANQIAAIRDEMERNPSLELPGPVEKMTYREAREFLDNLSPSEGQMKKLGYLIRENNVSDLIPSFIRESLKRGQVSKMIDLLVQKDRHGNIDTPALEKLVAQVDPPATPEQLETVRAYQENGSKIKLPKNPTYRQVEHLLNQEYEKQTIDQAQIDILKGWVAKGTVEAKYLKAPEKLTQAEYARLHLKHLENSRAMNAGTPAAPSMTKAPEMSGMSR